MMYWKKVDAGDFQKYGKEFLEYYKTNDSSFNHINRFWNELKDEKLKEVLELFPEMADAFSKFGVVKQIAMIYVWSKGEVTLHTDHTRGLNNGVHARLQIPILNTKGTRTAYFELTEEQYPNYTVSDGGTKFWPDDYKRELQPVDWVEINEPTIIRVSKPHTVYCDTNRFPRITMTVSFEDDLVKYLG
jgi:hypothetical protein